MVGWVKSKMQIQWCDQGEWRNYDLVRTDTSGEDAASGAGDYSVELTEASVGLRLRRAVASVPVSGSGASCEGDPIVWQAELAVVPHAPEIAIEGVQLAMGIHAGLACVWKPHLAPKENMAVGDKMFRSPAIVFEDATRMTAFVPDIAAIERERLIPHVMDYRLQDHSLMYGICGYRETGHVYYELAPEKTVVRKPLVVSFYLLEWAKKPGQRERDYRAVERFLWKTYAASRMPIEAEASLAAALTPYAEYAYGWALDRWRDVTWQQFTLNGEEVGGVVFIVCARQKPGLGQEEAWREPKSLWNQAWFCGLRTAYGYALWGRRQGRSDWIGKSELALNFALSAPQLDGLFPGYYQAGDDKRWESGRWYMSGPRRPSGHEDYVHLLDSSWTCYWLLKWHRDVRADDRILPYVRSYVDRLLRLQLAEGSFPAWVQPQTSKASPYLRYSPESSMHVMLLCLLHELEPDARYIEAAERAAAVVLDEVVKSGRWEDFETYWSCSQQWEEKQYGRLDPRSGLYNQCNFGMYWTAEGFKDLYRATGKAEWLDAGEQVLAEASLYQQIWQPPYFSVPTVGGFGVMNSDDEWNDARQSLFALTYQSYYSMTGDESYRARAMWAMKASFYMMYCPLNPEVKALYEQVHPQFNEDDYGFHMENFNHHDGTPVLGLGEFTIFDWGCGAAAASLAEFERNMQTKV